MPMQCGYCTTLLPVCGLIVILRDWLPQSWNVTLLPYYNKPGIVNWYVVQQPSASSILLSGGAHFSRALASFFRYFPAHLIGIFTCSTWPLSDMPMVAACIMWVATRCQPSVRHGHYFGMSSSAIFANTEAQPYLRHCYPFGTTCLRPAIIKWRQISRHSVPAGLPTRLWQSMHPSNSRRCSVTVSVGKVNLTTSQ